MRPNGHGLVSRLDKPEVWSIDLTHPDAEPQLVHEFENATGVANLCPLLGTNDEYAVLASIINLETVDFHTFVLWRLSLSPDGSQPPKATKLAEIPQGGRYIAVSSVTPRTLLLGDSINGQVWRVDVSTGKLSLLVTDDTMKIPEGGFFGINRMRVAGGHLHYTNNASGSLYRIPVKLCSTEGEPEITTAGPSQLLVDDIPSCDGLSVTADGRAAYMVNYMGGVLWRVDVDLESGAAATNTIMERLVSPTHVELVELNGRPVIYVVCGGEIQIGWINEDEKTDWSAFAQLTGAVEVSVTYTEEVA